MIMIPLVIMVNHASHKIIFANNTRKTEAS